MQRMNEAQIAELVDQAEALNIFPRADAVEAKAVEAFTAWNMDAQEAPLWAEKLRSTFPKLLEVKFAELAFAEGKVLPIDSRVKPTSLEWEYYQVEEAGCADWIDEDGHVMPTGTMKFKRFTGRMRMMGFKYEVNQFDAERFQEAGPAGFNLIRAKQNQTVKAHARLTNWTWGFGDSEKGLQGLCNHSNISKVLAPTADGSSSRLPADKSADEIMADFKALIFKVAEDTNEEYHCSKVILPHKFIRDLTAMRYPGDRYASVWEWIKDTFSGDDSGSGKVEFVAVNECDPARRRHPKTGVDDSGISGYFMMAMPANDMEERAFIRARPLTQLPPQLKGFTQEYWTHSKVGGCKMQTPLAVVRMDFGS
jgi:hypothetical protein